MQPSPNYLASCFPFFRKYQQLFRPTLDIVGALNMKKQGRNLCAYLKSVEIGTESSDETDIAFRRPSIAQSQRVTSARSCACVVLGHVTRHAQCARYAANHEAV